MSENVCLPPAHLAEASARLELLMSIEPVYPQCLPQAQQIDIAEQEVRQARRRLLNDSEFISEQRAEFFRESIARQAKSPWMWVKIIGGGVIIGAITYFCPPAGLVIMAGGGGMWVGSTYRRRVESDRLLEEARRTGDLYLADRANRMWADGAAGDTLAIGASVAMVGIGGAVVRAPIGRGARIIEAPAEAISEPIFPPRFSFGYPVPVRGTGNMSMSGGRGELVGIPEGEGTVFISPRAVDTNSISVPSFNIAGWRWQPPPQFVTTAPVPSEGPLICPPSLPIGPMSLPGAQDGDEYLNAPGVASPMDTMRDPDSADDHDPIGDTLPSDDEELWAGRRGKRRPKLSTLGLPNGNLGVSERIVGPTTREDKIVSIDFPIDERVISQIRSVVEDLERQYGRNISIVILDSTGQMAVDYNADISLKPASIIKLFIARTLFDLTDRYPDLLSRRITFIPEEHVDTRGTGILQHEREIKALAISDYLRLMIIHSDNIATNILIRELGLDVIDGHINSIGFANTRLRRRMYGFQKPKGIPENATTASDVAGLLAQLSQRQRDFIVELLREADEKRLIQQGLPSDVQVLTKSGILNDAYHEVGYIIWRGRLYPFAVLTARNATVSKLSDANLFLEIGRAIEKLFRN